MRLGIFRWKTLEISEFIDTVDEFRWQFQYNSIVRNTKISEIIDTFVEFEVFEFCGYRQNAWLSPKLVNNERIIREIDHSTPQNSIHSSISCVGMRKMRDIRKTHSNFSIHSPKLSIDMLKTRCFCASKMEISELFDTFVKSTDSRFFGVFYFTGTPPQGNRSIWKPFSKLAVWKLGQRDYQRFR